MPRPHIVLVTQEMWPLVQGGGIGRHVAEAARSLRGVADVTVLVGDRHRVQVEALRADGDERLPDVAFAFVEEPRGDVAPFTSWFHALSANTWRTLRDVLREKPAALVEWEDYRSPAAVTLDAKRTGAPELADTVMAVRLHTSWELTAHYNGESRDTDHARMTMALERLALRHADVLVPPNAATLERYRDHYGSAALAPDVVIQPPAPVRASETSVTAAHEGPLRILYAGRMERRKGVSDLARAVRALDGCDLRLTMVGGDTHTGPAGSSMRAHIGRLVGGDPRVALRDRVPRDELERLIDAHDLVVLPSRFESYGYIAREALARGRPVLTTPVGGFLDVVTPGRTGWLAADTSPEALADGLRPLVADPAQVRKLTSSGHVAEALGDEPGTATWVDDYLTMAQPQRAPATPRPTPGISAVVTALLPGDVAATVHAIRAQKDVGPVEIVVVTDDVARIPDPVASEVHELVVVGTETSRTAARERGVGRVADDRAILVLDAGDTPEPGFARAALRGLGAPGAPAYVTAFGTGRHPGNAPLGNAVADLVPDVDTGGSVALFAPGVLPADMPEGEHGADQALYAELQSLGRRGAVLPEALAGRIRPRRIAERERASARRPATDGGLATVGTPDEAVVAEFSDIYASRRWTDAIAGMPVSGRGSLPDRSRSVILHVHAEIEAGRVHSVADVGCGDLSYIQRVPAIVSGEVDYTGYDVVPDLLAQHRALPWGRFVVGDISSPGFRVDADLVLCKDVLFHLDDDQVLAALENLAASRWDQLILTSEAQQAPTRVFDSWHYAPVDFEAAPYALEPERRLYRVDGGAFLVVAPEQLRAAASRARAARAS